MEMKDTIMRTTVCAECKFIIDAGGCSETCKYNWEDIRPKEIWTWKLVKVEPLKQSGSSQGG